MSDDDKVPCDSHGWFRPEMGQCPECRRELQSKLETFRQLIRDALEDETEFDTEWDKAARETLKDD